jgi:hypothetical protein
MDYVRHAIRMPDPEFYFLEVLSMPTIKKKAYATKKQPGQQIVTITHQASAFVAANRKIVMIGLSVLVAVVLLAA